MLPTCPGIIQSYNFLKAYTKLNKLFPGKSVSAVNIASWFIAIFDYLWYSNSHFYITYEVDVEPAFKCDRNNPSL